MCIDCPVLSHPSFQHSAKCFRSSTLVSNISSLPLLIKNLQLLWTPPALILQKWQVVSSSSALIVVGTKNNIVTHSFIKYLLQTCQPMRKHWASSTGVQSHKMPWLPSSRLGYNTNATGRFQEGAPAVEYSMELERRFRWRLGQNIQGSSLCQGKEAWKNLVKNEKGRVFCWNGLSAVCVCRGARVLEGRSNESGEVVNNPDSMPH